MGCDPKFYVKTESQSDIDIGATDRCPGPDLSIRLLNL